MAFYKQQQHSNYFVFFIAVSLIIVWGGPVGCDSKNKESKSSEICTDTTQDDIYFGSHWDDCSEGDIPGAPWILTTVGNATAYIEYSDDPMPDHFDEKRGNVLRMKASDGGSVELARSEDSFYDILTEMIFSVKLNHGGPFAFGIRAKNDHEVMVILQEKEEAVSVTMTDDNGEKIECGTIPLGDWAKIVVWMDMETAYLSIDNTTHNCRDLVWQESDQYEVKAQFLMYTDSAESLDLEVGGVSNTQNPGD